METEERAQAAHLFARIKQTVKRPEHYIPRHYPTIGGMWTVETYRLNGVTFQLMDEGYSGRILAPGLDVTETMKGITFREGGILEMAVALNSLKGGKPDGE